MAIITCPECGKDVSDKAVSCPNCGIGTPGKAFKCPECEAVITEADAACKKCGFPVGDQDPNLQNRIDAVSPQTQEQSTNNRAWEMTLHVLLITHFLLTVVASIAYSLILPAFGLALEQKKPNSDYALWNFVLSLVAGIPEVLWIISCIGLYRLWNPARKMYLITAIIWLGVNALAYDFPSPQIQLGVVECLSDINYIVSGCILTTIFWTPARDLFARPNVRI